MRITQCYGDNFLTIMLFIFFGVIYVLGKPITGSGLRDL